MTTFATLKTDLNVYTGRGDSDAVLETAIRLAEALIFRKLRHYEMITADTITFSSQTMALPDGFRAMISISTDGQPWDFMSPQRLRSSAVWQYSWDANNSVAYTIEGKNITIAPPPSGSPVADILFWKALDPLSDTNTTNGLLQANYDLYLWAALAAVYDNAEDIEQEAKYLQKVAQLIVDLNKESRAYRRGSRLGSRQTGNSTP